KSAGVNRRARMTVLITWSARFSPLADTVAPAPRTARRRNLLPSTTERKAPLASNGVIRSLRDDSKLTSQIWRNGVVPFRQCVAVFEAEGGDQTRVRFETGRILFSVQIGRHNQAR